VLILMFSAPPADAGGAGVGAPAPAEYRPMQKDSINTIEIRSLEARFAGALQM